jgi:hypothetical protein
VTLQTLPLAAEPPLASTPVEPAVEYARRLALRRCAALTLARRERWLSHARLLVFLGALACAWFVFGRAAASPFVLLLPAFLFVLLVLLHDRTIRARARNERGGAFYERGMARLEARWIGEGEAGQRFLASDHLFAADLDLFGRGSLFEFLCSARTRAGEDTLAAWLCTPAHPDEVRARQAAVAELAARLDLREELALLGDEGQAGLAPEALARWAVEPAPSFHQALRIASGLLGASAVVSLGGWIVGAWNAIPFLAVMALETALAAATRKGTKEIARGVERPCRDLALLGGLLLRLEAEHFTSKKLVALRTTLDTAGVPPSRRVARLRLLVDLLDGRRNQLFAPLAALVLWATQLTRAIDAWRAAHGAAVPRWLATVGEIEALCALAGFAYEHPEHPFPEIVEEGVLFESEGLGHPLLPASRCVRNDLRLGGTLHVLVVSGSNMSGKSTLLRSVGTNALLALAGAPVCARRLRLSPLALGASIRIQDSLETGSSRFYAEITRLRHLVERASEGTPLLFLLDEILAGTNSHDRRIGAEAVVRGFIERGAIGLVTTHDLALARIAEDLAPRAGNVHFEDHLEDGRMCFDFRLRPGVVQKSNALALMRAVGLEV